MVVLKPKSSSFNSLWSISYSVIVVSVQCYISYRNISEYQDSLRNQWNRETPPEVGLKLGLTIVSFIVLPFFLLSSIFRTGNYGNDGYKLGRDHAICPISGGILDHIGSEFGRRLWRYAPPFAPSLHVLSAFCLLFPDALISAKEIQLQLKPTGFQIGEVLTRMLGIVAGFLQLVPQTRVLLSRQIDDILTIRFLDTILIT
uniref:Uncharacterized protein n=1 Tax=Magallana gigas TaxID=29159 RepID=A0A8W8IQP4_MAGGI